MSLDQQRMAIRHHLEAAVRSQRDSWDQSLAVEDLTSDPDRDMYAFVAELAGALKDDEPIPEDIIDTLVAGL
jgi:hypothetical protein